MTTSNTKGKAQGGRPGPSARYIATVLYRVEVFSSLLHNRALHSSTRPTDHHLSSTHRHPRPSTMAVARSSGRLYPASLGTAAFLLLVRLPHLPSLTCSCQALKTQLTGLARQYPLLARGVLDAVHQAHLLGQDQGGPAARTSCLVSLATDLCSSPSSV